VGTVEERKWRQRNPRDKRARLNRAALDSFRELGYARTAVELICRRAGVAVGTFYDNFESKRDLLAQNASADLALYFTADEFGDVSAIERVLRDFFRGDGGALWRAWREAVAVEPTLAARDIDITVEVHRRSLAAIADARTRAGLLVTPRDLSEIHWAIRALMREALRRSNDTPEDIEAVVARMINRVVHHGD
jgi:AcrR family transcriptional regulator